MWFSKGIPENAFNSGLGFIVFRPELFVDLFKHVSLSVREGARFPSLYAQFFTG